MSYQLIGQPLAHSHSPRIHALLGNSDYSLRPIAQDELPAFFAARAFDGLNVTIPYKRAVIPFLDALSERARAIGAVNTIKKMPDGTLFGDNTDGAGFAFLAARAGIALYGQKVLVLGTGGTSHTVKAVLTEQGAREIVTVSRTGEWNYQNVYEHQDADVIVNATPVGMYPNVLGKPLDLARFPKLSGVLDAVYNPLRTPLILQARALGLRASGGLPMLVEQARLAEELFLDTHIPFKTRDDVLAVLQKSLMNIVLIGMPGSGKTTVGTGVAKALGRELIDTDALVVNEAGMDIPEIFERYGEEHFREMEARAVRQACEIGGRVVTVGGGAVMNEESRQLIRMNGRVYMIARPIEKLDRAGRPLSKSTEILVRMQERREPIYRALADAVIENAEAPERAIRAVQEEFDAYTGD